MAAENGAGINIYIHGRRKQRKNRRTFIRKYHIKKHIAVMHQVMKI